MPHLPFPRQEQHLLFSDYFYLNFQIAWNQKHVSISYQLTRKNIGERLNYVTLSLLVIGVDGHNWNENTRPDIIFTYQSHAHFFFAHCGLVQFHLWIGGCLPRWYLHLILLCRLIGLSCFPRTHSSYHARQIGIIKIVCSNKISFSLYNSFSIIIEK